VTDRQIFDPLLRETNINITFKLVIDSLARCNKEICFYDFNDACETYYTLDKILENFDL